MIYYIAGLSLSRIPSLAAYKRAWRGFVGYAKRIRETSFTSHFEIGLHIYGVVNHTIYMQEYRSGHNEAVLKTVCPKGTGVRIPLPAPKKSSHTLCMARFLYCRDSNGSVVNDLPVAGQSRPWPSPQARTNPSSCANKNPSVKTGGFLFYYSISDAIMR